MGRATRRIVQIAIALPIAIALLAGTAMALDETSGSATTNAGNDVRFDVGCNSALVNGFCPQGDATGIVAFVVQSPNVYDDGLNGPLENINCDTINSYRLETTAKGYPRTRITATCVGTFEFQEVPPTVYVKAYFVDKGTPGTRDRINFYATENRAYRHNAELDPNRLVKDIGVIQSGDVVITH